MHKSIGILVAAALIGASFASGQESAPAVTTLPSIDVGAGKTYKIAPHEFDAYVGTYRFDDGHTLKVWQRGAHYFSQLKDETLSELKAASAGRFRTPEGTTLEFSDDAESVTMDRYGQRSVAMR